MGGTISTSVMSSVLNYGLAHPILSTVYASLGAFLIFMLWAWPYREYTLPYRNLPGPKPSSWLWGNFREIIKEPPNVPHSRWIAAYGNVFRYKSLFGRPRICLADPAGLAYIAHNTYDFLKPSQTVYTLELILGRGILTVEGAEHRRQRKILGPAFGAPAIKSMHTIVMEKAWELQRKLSGFLEEGGAEGEQLSPTPPKPEDIMPGTLKIDLFKYLQQYTLDVIGLAGFDYDFQALASKQTPLAKAFKDLFLAGDNPDPLFILSVIVPLFRVFPNPLTNKVKVAKAEVERLARIMVDRKRQVVEAELQTGEKGEAVNDVLSRVVRANMDPSLRADQRLSDKEVTAQVATFIIAGHETTASALCWTFMHLSQNPDVQSKLIDDVRAFPHDNPTFDELAALPYLDKVVHESLRLAAPVAGGLRVTSKHAVLPLSKPVKGLDGKMMDSIPIQPGTDIFIPVTNTNCDPAIWGPDADKFNPDRFDVDGLPLQQVPGVYGNVLTFFGGARNCIGYRLTLAEMKACLFAVFRRLEVLPLPSNPQIRQKAQIVTRPLVIGEEKEGYQMPLLLRALPETA